MKRIILILVLILLSFSVFSAQQNKVIVKSGTEISLQNETAVDAGKLQVGDSLDFKLAEEIKGEGTNISAGSEVYGRVVEVKKAAGNDDVSKVIMIFDFIKHGDDFLMLKAQITSVQGADAVKTESSEDYLGGTVLSINGKNLLIETGKIFRAKLIDDLSSN